METTQMTPFFSSTFSAVTVTFISEFENTQNSFSCGSPFDKFWSKIPQFHAGSYRFGQLVILFQKADILELLKINAMFCPSIGSQKKVSAHGLQPLILLILNNGVIRKMIPSPVTLLIDFHLVTSNNRDKQKSWLYKAESLYYMKIKRKTGIQRWFYSSF